MCTYKSIRIKGIYSDGDGCNKTIESVGWRPDSSMFYLILLFLEPNHFTQPPQKSNQGAMKHEVLESCLVHMVHN